jgi:hypothetical protein
MSREDREEYHRKKEAERQAPQHRAPVQAAAEMRFGRSAISA